MATFFRSQFAVKIEFRSQFAVIRSHSQSIFGILAVNSQSICYFGIYIVHVSAFIEK